MLRNKSQVGIGAALASILLLAALPILNTRTRSAAPVTKAAKISFASGEVFGFLESKSTSGNNSLRQGVIEKRLTPSMKAVAVSHPGTSRVSRQPGSNPSDSTYILDSTGAPVRLEPAESAKKGIGAAVKAPGLRSARDEDWDKVLAGDREASRRLAHGLFGPASGAGSDLHHGLENLVTDENPETNPFVTAIRDNFGAHAANAPPPAPPAPQKEDTATVKSPPSPPPGGTQETAPAVQQAVEVPAAVKNHAVVVGDFGTGKLQILNAAKTEGNSFAVDGASAPMRFDSGLDLGPLQSFALSQAVSQNFPDMLILDRRYGLVDIYSGIATGKFAFKDGFTFSAGEVNGAAAVDLDGDGEKDIVVGTHLLGLDSVDQGFVYLFLSKSNGFLFQKRIPLAFPAGGIYAKRLGEQVSILAVNQTLGIGELIVLDATGTVTVHAENLAPARRQDAKLNFTDGRPVWMRLAEFAEFGLNVNFIGAFEDGNFYLVGVLDNLRPFPFLAVGDLDQKSQRRCWIRF